MSALLRQPASVPALFSRAMDADLPAERALSAWRRLASSGPVLAFSGWALVTLVDMPLVKAATLAVALALPD